MFPSLRSLHEVTNYYFSHPLAIKRGDGKSPTYQLSTSISSGFPHIFLWFCSARNFHLYLIFKYIYIYISGWWFQHLWKILKSVGMIIPNIWKTKKCSKTPTRYVYRHTNSPAQRGTPTHESGGIWGHLQHGQIDITWRWNAVVTAMGCWTTKNRPVIYLGYSAKRYENMSCRYTSNVDMMGISWEYSGLIEST